MNPHPRLHTARHVCDLAPEARELAFYLLAERPYLWEAYEGTDLVAKGQTRTRMGLRLAVGKASWKWMHAHHFAKT